MRRLFLIGAIVALATACSEHEQAPPAQAPASSTAAPADTAFHEGTAFTGKDFTANGVQFTVTPDPLACDAAPGKAIVQVAYDARPAGFHHARVWIQRPNGKQSLWGQSPGWMDERPTGPWMGEGMRILLVDIGTGNVIAVHTVHAGRCP